MYDFKIEKTSRYYVEGNLQTAKHILYVLHGYGQLAKFFIRKFQSIVTEDIAIIAPEGLHRFYLNGSSGRVGASWMTKEAREQDISDNINYLTHLHQKILAINKNANYNLLGFSQGGATAARWLQHGKVGFKHFVLWASVFPPDLEGLTENSNFKFTTNHFYVGNKDQFFDTDQREDLKNELTQLNLKFDFVVFEGDHNIFPTPLSNLLEKLTRDN